MSKAWCAPHLTAPKPPGAAPLSEGLFAPVQLLDFPPPPHSLPLFSVLGVAAVRWSCAVCRRHGTDGWSVWGSPPPPRPQVLRCPPLRALQARQASPFPQSPPSPPPPVVSLLSGLSADASAVAVPCPRSLASVSLSRVTRAAPALLRSGGHRAARGGFGFCREGGALEARACTLCAHCSAAGAQVVYHCTCMPVVWFSMHTFLEQK